MANVAVPNPPGIVPPADNGLIRSPPQPNNPPTDTNISQATLYELDCLHAHNRREITQEQLAEATKFKHAVLTAANAVAVPDAPPPWLQQVVTNAVQAAIADAIQPLRDDITTLRNDMTTSQNALRNDMTTSLNALRDDMTTSQNALRDNITALRDDIATLTTRSAKVQRCAALTTNSSVGEGKGAKFEEVPFANGIYPWGHLIAHGVVLPELTTLAKVSALTPQESRAYHQGYYPQDAIPGDEKERKVAILRAIGCPERHAETV
ncbi:hypothetical protein B0H21DRAFT_735908 [Amylocystis lapponica]|nr:hypothetical protein B0H21DRAFT_735908 [Amylocystis lapponica]